MSNDQIVKIMIIAFFIVLSFFFSTHTTAAISPNTTLCRVAGMNDDELVKWHDIFF